MTPDPTCETCRHWIQSRLVEWRGKGVCTHWSSGPRPRREQVIRDLYTLREYWCLCHEVRMAGKSDMKGDA